MLGHILYFNAEVAAALVDIQGTYLEDGFVAGCIKIVEGDKVLQQGKQVAVIPDQLIHQHYITCFGLQGFVLVYQRQQLLFVCT